MELAIKIRPDIADKVTSDKMGLFISHEWKRLIDPYTPRDKGFLMRNVDILPFRLHYKVGYASYVYNGRYMNFQKKNPYSTYEWDFSAANAGQLDKLYRVINRALERNAI